MNELKFESLTGIKFPKKNLQKAELAVRKEKKNEIRTLAVGSHKTLF